MDKKINNHYIVILCGGTGPRLWPLSRASHPKQFLNIIKDESLLLQTIKRSLSVVDKNHIFVITNIRSVFDINKTVNNVLPLKNVIIEPEKKNTAMAILYATACIKKLNKDAIITTLPSDHYIKNISLFKKTLNQSEQVTKNTNSIVTIGITPTSPNPAYGYISTKETDSMHYNVTTFVEKPDEKLAQKLIDNGSFWNAGMYTFSINTIENETEKHQPKLFKLYNELYNNIGKGNLIEKIYSKSENIAIDKAISEKSKNLTLLPALFDWSDVGSWQSIYQNSKKDKMDNAIISKDTIFLEYNSKNCLINGQKNKLIGLVGVENLAIIDTPDSLLVCNMNNSFNVRDLVTKIVSNKKTEDFFLKNNEK